MLPDVGGGTAVLRAGAGLGTREVGVGVTAAASVRVGTGFRVGAGVALVATGWPLEAGEEGPITATGLDGAAPLADRCPALPRGDELVFAAWSACRLDDEVHAVAKTRPSTETRVNTTKRPSRRSTGQCAGLDRRDDRLTESQFKALPPREH